jgi:hypothetical protein
LAVDRLVALLTIRGDAGVDGGTHEITSLAQAGTLTGRLGEASRSNWR